MLLRAAESQGSFLLNAEEAVSRKPHFAISDAQWYFFTWWDALLKMDSY